MSENPNMAEGHRARLRERFIRTGLAGFNQYEILELLLFYCIPRRDTKPIAKELIFRFGSLSGVFDADITELIRVSGVTENTAVMLKIIPQLVGAYCAEHRISGEISGTESLISMFRPYFAGELDEKLMIACFDDKLRMMSVSELSRGGSSETIANLRRIIKEALAQNCSVAALAHNHPKGPPKPSDDDIRVTRQIIGYLSKVEIRLIDHIIIGKDRDYSMRDGGDLGIFD